MSSESRNAIMLVISSVRSESLAHDTGRDLQAAPYLLQTSSVTSEPGKPSSAGMAQVALPQRTAQVVLPPALFGA